MKKFFNQEKSMRSLLFLLALICLPAVSYSAQEPTTSGLGSATNGSQYAEQEQGVQTVHQFDRFLLVFHYQEVIQFDQLGNIDNKESLFGNSRIEINPSFVTNQHGELGIKQGKAGLSQVVVLEQPVNEVSEAAVHFIESTATGINIVSIYEIEERPNVFRCYYTRVKNNTDRKANTNFQTVAIDKGLAYPINQEGEHIKEVKGGKQPT